MTMVRRGIAALAGLLGCTPATTPAPAGEPAEPDEPSVQTPPEPEPEDPQPEPEALLEIGWSPIPNHSTADAVRENKQALARHRDGDYEDALTGFVASETASPGYHWPRYNAACANSRLGKTKAAADAMASLLLEDLPTFRPRLLEDEDLQALRDSAEGKALLARLPNLMRAYNQALERGAPAMIYTEHEDVIGLGDRVEQKMPYSDLRIGVYDHTTKRMVPMVPEVARAYAGVLDVKKKRAIVAYGRLHMKDMWEIQPHNAKATVFSLDELGKAVQQISNVSPRADLSYGFELWVGPDDDTVFGTMHGVGYSASIDYYKWTGKRRKKIGWTGEVGIGPEPEPPTEIPYGDPSVQVIDIAKAFYRRPTEAKVRRRSVEHESIEGELKLEPGHHKDLEVIASPDPMIIAVVSNAIRFTMDGGEFWEAHNRPRHVVDIVDLHEQKVHRLTKAKGYGHVVWAPDGTLFLDAPTGVSRYAPGSTAPQRDVLEGVRFGTPPLPEVGGV